MKKFKPNKITTLMFAMLEFLAPFCVGFPVMILLIGNDNYTINEVLSIFPLFIIMLILIIVAAIIALFVIIIKARHRVNVK